MQHLEVQSFKSMKAPIVCDALGSMLFVIIVKDSRLLYIITVIRVVRYLVTSMCKETGHWVDTHIAESLISQHHQFVYSKHIVGAVCISRGCR